MTPLVPLAGLRLGALQPVDAVGYEQFLVVTPDEAAVTQGVVRGAVEVGRLGLEGALPWVYSAGGGYRDGATGRVRLAGGIWVGRRRAWQLGLELAANPADAPGVSALAWGTRARDVVPGEELLAFASWADPSGVFAVRAALGVQESTYVGAWPSYLPIATDLALVAQAPLADRWWLVGEADLCTDWTWLTVRPALRHARGAVAVDVGLQLPWPALAETATFQPFVQVRLWRPPGPVSPLSGPDQP